MKKSFMRRVNNLTDRQVLYLLVVVVLVTSGWSAVLNLTSGQPDFQAWGEGWLQNFSTEMTGAISTFWLFSLVIGNRQDKKRLVIQMRSKDNAIALQAVDELRENGWLEDGSLHDAFLRNANLQGAFLGDANLQEARLFSANLQGVYLGDANLQGARLFETNLKDADFGSANLQGAHLRGADLQGAYLGFAKFDETTTLPDLSEWTLDTDMTRFTDPNHPDFWRSDDPGSPAYRGDSS